MASFLLYLTAAFQNWPEEEYQSSISHRTAQLMLGDNSLLDLGAFDFMGAKVGSCSCCSSSGGSGSGGGGGSSSGGGSAIVIVFVIVIVVVVVVV